LLGDNLEKTIYLVPMRRVEMQSRRASVARRDAGASALGSHVARGNQNKVTCMK